MTERLPPDIVRAQELFGKNWLLGMPISYLAFQNNDYGGRIHENRIGIIVDVSQAHLDTKRGFFTVNNAIYVPHNGLWSIVDAHNDSALVTGSSLIINDKFIPFTEILGFERFIHRYLPIAEEITQPTNGSNGSNGNGQH